MVGVVGRESADNVKMALGGLKFPTSKDEILNCAKARKASEGVRDI